tara:strand:- start:5176 stop:5808 length:633 start_codon:yes stop_codon:yes gene_type:complete
LLHGGLILLVSGWETYCEDVSKEAVKKITEAENLTFDDLSQKIRRQLIRHSYPPNIDKVDPLETGLAKLPGEGWRGLFVEMIEEYLSDFNTPKFTKPQGKNLQKLFKLYLEGNVMTHVPSLTRTENITEEIDRIISVRGDIAHRGKPLNEDRFYADDLICYLEHVRNACAAIDSIIWREFRTLYGITPWRMTQTIQRLLPGFNIVPEDLA